MEQKDFFTTNEVAEILGISRQAVFKKIKSGEIKAKKIGRNYVVAREDLPQVFDVELTEKQKKELEKAVSKTTKEYKETLELLGKE